MSDLRLRLDTIDFDELVELGRSMIPTIAPGWTDHNVHDPGIMLMELIAWVADAQVYSLARTRRDERRAYAELLGITAHGPRPASGLIWPRIGDGGAMPWPAGTIIDAGAAATTDRAQAPAFFTTGKVVLTTALLTRVATQFADGTTRDWTRANTQPGATFLPFGEHPATGDRLQLEFVGPLSAAAAAAAPLSIGFDIASDRVADNDDALAASDACRCSPVHVAVTLTNADGDWPVSVADDTTDGLAHSGVLLLRVDEAAAAGAKDFTIAIESQSGAFLRTPRVQHIAVNVLPVEQRERIQKEVVSFGKNLPDQTYTLDRDGLIHPVDAESFSVELSDANGFHKWAQTSALQVAGPDEFVYALDPEQQTITFGNGINGTQPGAGSTLRVGYQVSAGTRGNLPQGVSWTVRGVSLPFENRQAMSGGADADSLLQLRGIARRRVREARPLVTKSDLERAALSFADLGVTRASELAVSMRDRQVQGTRILVVVGPHGDGTSRDQFVESRFWLGEIQRRLAPRLPLGQRLEVIGPRLVTVRVRARVVAAPQRDVMDVRANVESTLWAKLALVERQGNVAWPFGRDVTLLAVKGWIRNVDGVARVADVSLISDAVSPSADRVLLGSIALPRFAPEPGDIDVERFPLGGRW
jgi:hypothetical protein